MSLVRKDLNTYENLIAVARSTGIEKTPELFFYSARLMGLRKIYVEAVINRLMKENLLTN